MTPAGFIVAQRVHHAVPRATSCPALGVSQSWFYKWRDGDRSVRHARRAQLAIGAFKRITYPVVGNHEYGTRGAAGYFHYLQKLPSHAPAVRNLLCALPPVPA